MINKRLVHMVAEVAAEDTDSIEKFHAGTLSVDDVVTKATFEVFKAHVDALTATLLRDEQKEAAASAILATKAYEGGER